MYQRIIIVGRLGADPEQREGQSGESYVRFPLAVNRTWLDAAGERREEVTWHHVVVWGKAGAACKAHLKKGDLALVEAERLRASAYLGKDGQPAASLDVTASRVRFLGNGRREDTGEEEAGEGEAAF
jgi:single-strand DNA-binding protein